MEVVSAQARHGHQAEYETRNQGEREGKAERGKIDGDVIDPGYGAGAREPERPHRPDREQETERTAHEGEQHALGENLAGQPPAGCAECGAEGDLTLARGKPREHQIGDVGARDAAAPGQRRP